MRFKARTLICMIFAAWCVAGSCTRAVAQDEARVVQFKVAYTFNMIKFTKWPQEAFPGGQSPLVVGILGDSALGQTFAASVGERLIGGRRVVMHEINLDNKNKGMDTRLAGQVKGCHVLIVSSKMQNQMKNIVASLNGAPVLLISDMDKFAMNGGMVGLVVEGEKIRININLKRVKEYGLVISSNVLKIARIVESNPQTHSGFEFHPLWIAQYDSLIIKNQAGEDL